MSGYNKTSKYIKEGNIKLSKKFIASVILTKAFQIILFLGIVGILSYGGYSIFSSNKIPLNDGKIVSVSSEEEPTKDSYIVYSKDEKGTMIYDKILFFIKKKTALEGKVVGIPYEIVEFDNKTIQLKQKEYLLLNQNNESKIVNIKNIYGIEKSWWIYINSFLFLILKVKKKERLKIKVIKIYYHFNIFIGK